MEYWLWYEPLTTTTNFAFQTLPVTDEDRVKVDEFDHKRKVCVNVPPSEYMLGLADLTGELMRMAINYVGSGDLQKPFELCCFMRTVFDSFSTISGLPRELYQKLRVFKQSLMKVEKACYTLQVRGSEMPQHMLKDVFTDSASHDADLEF